MASRLAAGGVGGGGSVAGTAAVAPADGFGGAAAIGGGVGLAMALANGGAEAGGAECSGSVAAGAWQAHLPCGAAGHDPCGSVAARWVQVPVLGSEA